MDKDVDNKLETAKKPKKPKKAKPKSNGKKGRKSHYDTLCIREKLGAIAGWAKEGSTDADIMKMLGIGKETFYKWKREKPEFADALKKGKEISNGELLNSAYKQSTGFYVDVNLAVKVKKPVRDPDGVIILVQGRPVFEECVEIVPSKQYIEPNSTMNIFMLKNRMPDKYKDKHEVDHTFGTKLEDFFGGTKEEKE